jgi:hypothetical protein
VRIKWLARKAVFITAAVMVLVGFSTGIAGTASAAPTSTVSAVSSSPVTSGAAATVPRMPANCGNHFCTLGLSGHSEFIIQEFNCVNQVHHPGIINPIYGMQNNCSNRVFYYNPHRQCVNPHSSIAGVGRFGQVNTIWVERDARC